MGAGGSKVEMKAADVAIVSTEEQPKADKPKACKACCACPETKRVRDACIVENGEENCTELIQAHKECMRKMGFNI